MANFLAELKRRHVYRVAAGYAVVAWLLLQLVNNITPIMAAPLWVAQFCLLILVIGFPLAIFLAWTRDLPARETAPPNKVATTDFALIGTLLIVIALSAYQQLAPTSDTGAVPQQANLSSVRTAANSPATAISLAVLPFANLSGDPGQEFFSDGMTEELTTALAKVPDLRVVGRTSAFQFKGENKDLRAIGQALSATHLIEGSVRKAGDRVRITAQLIKSDDGTHIWAENYDRELTDIFAIQEDIARAITSSLNMSLGLKSGEQLISNRAIDTESYEQYLRGKAALLRARTAYEDQIALLEPVVAKNPNYAPGWAAVAQAYRYAGQFGRYTTLEGYKKAREVYEPKMNAAARRAVELDPNFVDGKVMLARIQTGPRRLILVEEILVNALNLDPNNPGALDYYSSLLALAGKIKQAVAMKQQVHLLEPYGAVYTGNLAQALWQDGQTDAAIALWKDSLRTEGAGAALGLSRIYASLGRYSDAADIADQMISADRFQRLRDLISTASSLLRTAPKKAAAPEKLPRLTDFSYVYLYIGAPERALEPYEEGNLSFNDLSLLWLPAYEPVRKTERFKNIVLQAGLIAYWRERGWPSFCHPTTGDDFACS